jgi:hypothetical protein
VFHDYGDELSVEGFRGHVDLLTSQNRLDGGGILDGAPATVNYKPATRTNESQLKCDLIIISLILSCGTNLLLQVPRAIRRWPQRCSLHSLDDWMACGVHKITA